MRLTAIPPEAQPVSLWRNAGGVTREIFRCGPEPEFHWRASLARIERGGPFSPFPGYQRSIALVDGGPLQLVFDNQRRLELDPRLKAYSFPGGVPPRAELEDAPAAVFNLIASDRLTSALLLPRPLVGAMVLFDHPQEDWLIYMLSGEAELRVGEQRRWLGSEHGLLLEGESHGGRAVLDGGGEIVLVKIAR